MTAYAEVAGLDPISPLQDGRKMLSIPSLAMILRKVF